MDSPFYHSPQFDPALDAQVAAWVLLTKQKDWAAMTEAEQAFAYVEYAEVMTD